MGSQQFIREVAEGLTKFYEKLCQTPCLSPDMIQEPPPNGWSDSNLDLEGLRIAFGRSESVVQLLRHLPYLKPAFDDIGSGQPCIFPRTKAMCYLQDNSSLQVANLEGRFELCHLPPNLISLTYPSGEYYLYGPQWWLVNCETERVSRYAGPPRGEALAEEFTSEWKKSSVYSAPEFFDEMTSMVGRDFYPIPACNEAEASFATVDQPDYGAVYQTYMLAGWQHGHGPSPTYDREKCRLDLYKLMQAKAEEEQVKEFARTIRPLRTRKRTSEVRRYSPGYDQAAIVNSISLYYETLSQMAFFPSLLIQYPPNGRWDDEAFLSAQQIKLLGFNHRVSELLRHLPYLDFDESHEDNQWPVYARHIPQRYLADNAVLHEELTDADHWQEALCSRGEWPFLEQMPNGLLPFAGGGDPVDGEWWILDTDAGTVIEFSGGGFQEVDGASDEKPWLWTRPKHATKFFDALLEALFRLDLVPMPRPNTDDPRYYPEIWGALRDESDEQTDDEVHVEVARRIYLEHGWPDVANFRRRECYDALVAMRTKRVEDGDEDNYGPE